MSCRGKGAYAVAVAVLLVLLPAPVAADSKRVAVVNVTPGLERAIATALEPWGIEVMAAQTPTPAGALAAIATRARALAHANHAAAVVWITADNARAALFVYDAAGDTVTALPLALAPPLDEPTQAAVALSIKAVLRHSAVGPVLRDAAPAQPTAAPRLDIAVDIAGGVRIRPGLAQAAEPRLRLAARWLPAGARGHLALTLQVDTGLGVAVNGPSFVGRYTDTWFGIAVEGHLPLRAALATGVALGTSAHVSTLAGQPMPAAPDLTHQRLNPALDLAWQVQGQLGRRLQLGAWAAGSYMLRRQQYLVGPVTVLDLPAVEATVGLRVGLLVW